MIIRKYQKFYPETIEKVFIKNCSNSFISNWEIIKSIF